MKCSLESIQKGEPVLKKLLPLLLFLALVLTACGPAAVPESDDDNTVLVATTYPVYLFTSAATKDVGGYDVWLMIDQPVSCLHDYTLTVRDMRTLEGADVILMNGAGLEDTMSDALEAVADTPVIDCSRNIDLLPLQGHHHDEDEGKDHDGEVDPHIWMDPALACVMVDNIAAGLSEEDPNSAEAFAANAQAAKDQITACYADLKAQLSDLSPRELITFHDGFSYFARAFDLTILRSIEEEAGSEASAKEVSEIIDLIQTHDLPAIFVETNGPNATAQAIGEECGKTAPFTVGVLTLIMSRDPDNEGIDAYCAGLAKCADVIQEAYS